MTPNFNSEERELAKLVKFFKKRVSLLSAEKKAEQDYPAFIETCDKLMEQLNAHAEKRTLILHEREQLKSLVKDHALCPKCNKADQLKVTGSDKSPQGWKSNKYKCRRCNISFVWNAPNNPWDMIPYAEHVMADIEKKMTEAPEQSKDQMQAAVEQMKNNIAKLKPIVEASDLDITELELREKEVAEVIKKFRKQLMIEKIRIED